MLFQTIIGIPWCNSKVVRVTDNLPGSLVTTLTKKLWKMKSRYTKNIRLRLVLRIP